MSAIRRVTESSTIPLNPHHVCRHRLLGGSNGGFREPLPLTMLQNQPDQDRIEDLWTDKVCPTITTLCYARTSSFINKHIRRTAFHSGMENVCKDFNRSTLNLKIEFQIIKPNNPQKSRISRSNNKDEKAKYALIVSKLSDIEESIFNPIGQYCTAEIPYREPDPVEAEHIGPISQIIDVDATTTAAGEVQANTVGASSSDEVPIVTIIAEEQVSYYEGRPTASRSIYRRAPPALPRVIVNNCPDPSFENVPIYSTAVAVVVDDDQDAEPVLVEGREMTPNDSHFATLSADVHIDAQSIP